VLKNGINRVGGRVIMAHGNGDGGQTKNGDGGQTKNGDGGHMI